MDTPISPLVSPLAPKELTVPPAVPGVQFATGAAGIKYQDRTDVLLAVFEPGTQVAGVLTTSKCPSAAVEWCRTHLPLGVARGVVVNSGNANVFTGLKGAEAVSLTAKYGAQVIGCDTSEIFLASTGVIGEPLDGEKFSGVLETCAERLTATPWLEPAKAIMTTDTYPKLAQATLDMDGVQITIAGIAKGAGMIAPDMATMLVYLFTDAKIDQGAFQSLVSAHTDSTFNCITVDSDTSTSDTLIACATGASSVDVTGDEGFAAALHGVMLDLAHQVIRDGEGATKFVEITVRSAATDADARRHALAIANSPLVKTAIAGEDPNWGRIVMAVGKSGAAADRDLLGITFGEVRVAENGWVHPDYKEADAAAHMKGEEIRIGVDIGLGTGTATIWTCDLTHGYIDINADYRS